MSSKDLTVLFGLAVAYAPHRADRPSTARSNSRPRSVGILRVRGSPLLRRVQMMKRHHVQLAHRIHRRQSRRRGSRCGLKGENTKFLGRSKLRNNLAGRDRAEGMLGYAKETPFFRT